MRDTNHYPGLVIGLKTGADTNHEVDVYKYILVGAQGNCNRPAIVRDLCKMYNNNLDFGFV
jgi:hypothetical protein